MLLLLISFIAGALTVLAPCVLPLLPVIIGGSIGGGNRSTARPFIIGASLAASIIVFTLALKVSTVLINVPPSALNWLSGGLLVALGIAATLPEWWEKVVIYFNLQAASQRLLATGERSKHKYTGAILIGIALGPVFASCSPTYAFILASVLPRSLASGLLYLTAYTIGLALALLLASLAGRKYLSRYGWAINTHSIFRRSLGVLFIIIGLTVFGGYQIGVETWVANHLPFDETKLEQILLSSQSKSSLKAAAATGSALNVQPTPAPELAGLTNWINSAPLTIAGLHGKVVLVDFWTYSCINCIRSIPYVEKWYQTYHSQGLEIIGVNTPEFAFEHNPDNVAGAVKKDGITYPVALDNNYDTWNAFNNNSWPADYLIDQNGDIRYVSLGEGDYDKTEKAIQALLNVNQPLQTSNFAVPASAGQSPETYFGTGRAQSYIGTPDLANGQTSYTPASSLQTNAWTLGGSWQIQQENVTSASDTSTLTFHANAKDVYLVAGTTDGASRNVTVQLSPSSAQQYGADDPKGVLPISGSRLYHIVALPRLGDVTITLTVPKNVNLYTFTFGS